MDGKWQEDTWHPTPASSEHTRRFRNVHQRERRREGGEERDRERQQGERELERLKKTRAGKMAP